MKEQHPILDAEIAEHFDEDNKAIVHLHLRGLITESQRNAAYKKLANKIEKAIRYALSAQQKTGEKG